MYGVRYHYGSLYTHKQPEVASPNTTTTLVATQHCSTATLNKLDERATATKLLNPFLFPVQIMQHALQRDGDLDVKAVAP